MAKIIGDRLQVTFRFTRSGEREWLDSTGRIALVFFEHGSWWFRPDDRTPREEVPSEDEGLKRLYQPFR